jgi:hypothetical protein
MMTEQDQWTYDVFAFGMQLDAYLRDSLPDSGESYIDRLKRTLVEIAEGETSITQGDTELRLSLAKMDLPEDMRKALVEVQRATRARHKVIAAKLLELTRPGNAADEHPAINSQ